MELSEILTSAGLDESAVENVLNQMKENKIYISGEENLDIRYSKLKGEHDALKGKHGEAESLIAQLQEGSADNQALQSKISDYEARIAELEQEKSKTEAEAALKVALLEAKAEDIDYLTFKIREKGEIKLDENGKIVGIDDTITELKTKFPTQFQPSANEKKIEEQKLEQGEERGITREKFEKMGYQDRNKLQREDPETYEKLSKGD